MPNSDGSIMTDIINMLTGGGPNARVQALASQGKLATQDDRQMDPLVAQERIAKEARNDVEWQMGKQGYAYNLTQVHADNETQRYNDMLQERQMRNMQPVLDAIAQKPDIAAALKAFQELQQGGKNYVKE